MPIIKFLLKTALFVVGAIILLFLVYNLIFKLPSRNLSWGDEDRSTLGIQDVSDFFKNIFKTQPITVLIFGKPGLEYNAGELSDTIMLAHYNPDSQKAYLISIPRDLWIADGKEQFKINEVIYKKKIPQVLDKMKTITGLNPDGFVIIDLNTVSKAIDFLGGVDVVLNEAAVDWVSGFTLEKGAHHLDGEYAIWLIRNRYNKEGDFFREKNQQEIIKGLLEKFKNLDKDKKSEFVKTFVFSSQVLKNSSIDVSKITPYIFDSSLDNITLESVVLDFSTKLLKTENIPLQFGATTTYVSALIPSAGFENYTAIRDYIQSKLTNN
ncbi:MAG: LCP family protein [Candidatus Paceibacterota bacterium]|jgi:LCP family protein required for cell wall assembly